MVNIINMAILKPKLICIYIFSKLGGGGVGKSFLIKLLSQWIDYILQEPGDVTYYPKVIRLAATGNAAYLIGMFIYLYTYIIS